MLDELTSRNGLQDYKVECYGNLIRNRVWSNGIQLSLTIDIDAWIAIELLMHKRYTGSD